MSSNGEVSRAPRQSGTRPLEQFASVALGACLLQSGWHRRGLGGGLRLAMGAALTLRGVRGHCALYDAAQSAGGAAAGSSQGGWQEARCSIAVARPAAELYRRWRDLQGLPRILSHVKDVRVIDDRRSHWVVAGPAGTRVEFESRIEEDVPDRRIAWRSAEDAEVRNEGSVEFNAEGPEQTRLVVRLRYRPPAGVLGQLAAKLFGADPDRQLADDMLHFKQRMEREAPAGPGRSGAAAGGAAPSGEGTG